MTNYEQLYPMHVGDDDVKTKPVTPKKRIGILMFLVVMLSIAIPIAFSWLFLEDLSPLTVLVLNTLLITVGAILIPTLIHIFKGRRIIDTYNMGRLPWNQVIPCVLFGIGLCFAALILSNILMGIYEHFGADLSAFSGSELPDLRDPVNFIVTVICICVAPAVCEELLCRSAILYSLRTKGMYSAALWSGLYFALLHTNFVNLPMYIALGFIFGIIAYKTRSVFSTMIVHFFYNFMVILLELLVSDATPSAQSSSIGITTVDFWVSLSFLATVAAVFLVPATIMFIKNCRKNDIAYSGNDAVTVYDEYNSVGDMSVPTGKGFIVASMIILMVLTGSTVLSL